MESRKRKITVSSQPPRRALFEASMEFKDYYSILGVEPGAGDAEI